MKRELEEGEEPPETDASKKARAEESQVTAASAAAQGDASAAQGDASAAQGEVSAAQDQASAASTEAVPASGDDAASAAAAAAACSDAACASAASYAAGLDGTYAAPPPAAPALLSDDQLVGLLRERAEAKSQRDFANSDRIRMQLEQYGIKIIDARQTGMMGTWTAADGRRYARAPCPPLARPCPPIVASAASRRVATSPSRSSIRRT